MQRFLPTTLLLLLLCCCASAPPPSAKLAPARHALARAYAEGAPDLAREDYRRAKARLEQGARLNREDEPGKADLVLTQAIFFALRAREKSQQAWEADIDRPKIAGDPESESESAAARDDFVVKILSDEADSAREGKSEPRQPDRRKPAKQAETGPVGDDTDPPLPKEYVVGDGETLWSIAAHRIIYRDALLWPLIYKANRDQIKDPRQIFPQQVLTVPRDIAEGEREEAREKARRSEIFPVEVLMRQVVGDEK